MYIAAAKQVNTYPGKLHIKWIVQHKQILFSINKCYEGGIVKVLLPINFNICFGWSKEQSHWDGSFEYP